MLGNLRITKILLIMENIVMRYFRKFYGHTPTEIAYCVPNSVDEYLQVITNWKLLSDIQAEQLALLFNLKKGQLDLLLGRNAIISLQKQKIGFSRLRLQNIQSGTLKDVLSCKTNTFFKYQTF